MPEPQRSDDIDLLQLLVKTIHVVKTNFLLIVICVLLGAGFGLMRYYGGKKLYESRMIVSSKILTDSYTTIIFDNINRHLSENNNAIVVKHLGLSEDVVKKIESLELEPIQKGGGNLPEEKDRFLITVEVSDQKILPELQKGIIYYLENNEYVKVRIEMSRRTTKQMLASVDKEITDMQVLKERIASGEFFKSASGNIMFDPTSVNSKILELSEKKLNYENTLELSNSVYVIEGFSEFEKQTRPKLSISLGVGAVVGLFGAFLVLAMISVGKLMKSPAA